MSETHNYLHIPKTGGTAIKYAIDDNPNHSPKVVIPSHGHSQHLRTMNKNTVFMIRHPLERFCSGFWERKTVDIRKKKSETEFKDLKNFGYKPLGSLEKTILEQCATPDQFLDYLREGGKTEGTSTALFELTAPFTNWTGKMEEFQKHEDKITMVFHINNLTHVMKSVYNLDMPKDPFRQRSRKLFDIDQPYNVTGKNRLWFENEYRKEEYELIAYIKTRPYYLS